MLLNYKLKFVSNEDTTIVQVQNLFKPPAKKGKKKYNQLSLPARKVQYNFHILILLARPNGHFKIYVVKLNFC